MHANEKIKITTNNRERKLYAWTELPSKEAEWFDYVDESERDTPRFVKAYGAWYDTNDAERAPDQFKRQGFDTYATQSFFNAIAYRWFDKDGYELEGVVVGYATW